MNSKRYLKIIFSLFGLMVLGVGLFVYQYSKKYPLPFTGRISFDAKIKFIKEHVDVSKVDTIIVGSSIGLNDIQGVYMQDASEKCHSVLNMSVYEASPVQAEQLLFLVDAFPQLKRVIYSAQFSDFQHTTSFRAYHPRAIRKYIDGGFHPTSNFKFIFDAAKDLPFLVRRAQEWVPKHGQNNRFTYLGFDASGSVPLHIYGKDIIQKRWNRPHGSRHLPKAFEALDRMNKRMKEKGIAFYFVQQPYRQPLIKKYLHVEAELNWFYNKVSQIMKKNNQHFLSLYKKRPLSDAYFADRSHLNDKGSIITARYIGKFIDKTEE